MPGDAAAPSVELLHAADAEDRQRRAAGALLARGCTRGDRVAFALGSSADLICAALGAARVGLIPVMLNATLTAAERDDLADDARPTVRVFTQPELHDLIEEGRPTELAPYPLTRPMHYTSGTTGKPKGVTTGLWDERRPRRSSRTRPTSGTSNPTTCTWSARRCTTPPSIRFAGCTLLAGGSLVILSRFDAATALDALRRHRPTTTFMVPTHLQRILQAPGLGPDERFDSLRLLAHAGAPCPEPVKRAVMARSGPAASGSSTARPRPSSRCARPRTGSSTPAPSAGPARAAGSASSRSPTTRWPPGPFPRQRRRRRGTIWCDMPTFARFSYWDDPAATAAAWNGSACTVGDLGRLDADGFLYLTGRRHDLIISGGVNVYPAEVENVLAAVDGIAEVAVFGLPDEQWGQRVCAAYVADGRGRSSAEEALRAAASARLAPYKRPKTYFAAADLPHTATGKLMRRAVPEHLGLPG